jgi:hypothetical protein
MEKSHCDCGFQVLICLVLNYSYCDKIMVLRLLDSHLYDPSDFFRRQGRSAYKQIFGRQRCHDRTVTLFLILFGL